MPFYEVVFITRQDITPKEVDGITANVAKILDEKGGKIVRKEYWGLRTLAYKIKKNAKGHYVMLHIESEFPAIAEIERVMKYDEKVIRRVTFRLDELPAEDSELMISENARDYKVGKVSPRRESEKEETVKETSKEEA